MAPALSVIIPVYKVEKYLRRCVDSVLNQDYKDMEVILVDDGSPDGCPAICDEYASKYQNVRAIHKPNGGLSSARNAGIAEAAGKYAAFLDSDDQWAENMLGPVMTDVVLEEPDMTLFQGCDLLPDGSLVRRNYGSLFCRPWRNLPLAEYYGELIAGGDLHEAAYTKIMKLEFIRANALTFREGITGEDTEWMFRVLRKIENVSISAVSLYIYTDGREGSISNSISVRNVRDLMSTICGSIEFYKEHTGLPTERFELAQCAYLWSTCLAFAAELPENEAGQLFAQLENIGKGLDLNAHPKSRKASKVYRRLGIRGTAKLLALYLSLHRKNILGRKTVVK